MMIPMLLFLFLAVTFRGIRADVDSITKQLGKGINLRKTNVLDDFQQNQANVFEELPPNCFIQEKLHRTKSDFKDFANTKELSSNLAAGAELDASLAPAFSFTLNSVFGKTGSKESNVHGTSLNIRALTQKILLKKDCQDETSKLKKSLVKDFENLPLKLDKPWSATSWKGYDAFLNKYGSHVLTSATLGASIMQYTFAERSKSYSERELEVKSCLSLAGPTNFGKIEGNACGNISKSEIDNAKKMKTEEKLVIRGGAKETRNALKTKRTEELVEKFLNESGEADDSGVANTFRPMWNILQSRFQYGSENFIRAVNMQYYYLGYLNYGCRHIFSQRGDVHIQKFDYTNISPEDSPEFECTLAAKGCHSDDDCHYKHWLKFQCSCYGPSCILYKDEEQDTGSSKVTAYANIDDKNWPEKEGCKVKGFSCHCKNRNIGVRTKVWMMSTRDIDEGQIALGSGSGDKHNPATGDGSGEAGKENDQAISIL